jgi:hypothetical protein
MLVAASEAAAGTAGPAGEHVVQIDATGSQRAAHAPAAMQAADDGSDRLMRQEVRRHIQEEPEKIEFDQLDEVKCPVSHGLDSDSVVQKLCKILTGSNNQVAGKLERAVKGLSLRPKTANATEYEVADKTEEKQLVHLRAALWDLWFCAKRADPPCDPMTSTDHKVEVARQQAVTALQAIRSHPEAGLSTTLAPGAATDAERIDHVAGGSVMPVPEEAAASQSPEGWSTARSHRSEGTAASHRQVLAGEPASLLETKHSKDTPVAKDSKFAEDVLTGLLNGDDKKEIQKRLWNAINKMDIQKVLEDDIVKIEDDTDGNYKALKANLLLLHECATMPECPATNCCNPKSPEQANYKEARNAAYQAYHDIQHDTSLAKQTYLDLLSTVASGKHKDYYPPGHPLYVPTTAAPSTTTAESEPVNVTSDTKVNASAPPVEEGNMLLIAICMVTGIVIIAIAFLLHKTNSMDGKGGGGGGGGEAAWGGEGEYGAESYGGY